LFLFSTKIEILTMVLKIKERKCVACGRKAKRNPESNIYICPIGHTMVVALDCERCGKESIDIIYNCHSKKHKVCEDCVSRSRKYLTEKCSTHLHKGKRTTKSAPKKCDCKDPQEKKIAWCYYCDRDKGKKKFNH
jgi:hypothetical protein